MNTQNSFDIAKEMKTKKIKIFRDFRFLFDIWFSISAFHFEPYTQKRKLGNTETLQKGYNT